jgi:hypothetical protein
VDFDGTVVDHMYPYMGAAVPGALEWMKAWSDQGGKIILWTMRDEEELEAAVEYLLENEVPLYGVNRNPDQAAWTASPKAYANVYVDDLALGVPLHQPDGFHNDCVDWGKVGPEVYSRLLGVDNALH